MSAKKATKDLYFIALVPEEPVYSEIWQLKNEMLERFETRAALRSPPHVTLHMPFKWPQKKEVTLFTSLQSIAGANSAFSLTLKNFGAFEPRVIYVQIDPSEALTSLQKAVARAAAAEWHIYPQPASRPFRPHMTIAFRDLKKARFYEAWQEFARRQYSNTMLVSQLCLLKHNGRHWEKYRHFALKEKGQP